VCVFCFVLFVFVFVLFVFVFFQFSFVSYYNSFIFSIYVMTYFDEDFAPCVTCLRFMASHALTYKINVCRNAIIIDTWELSMCNPIIKMALQCLYACMCGCMRG
jgi:hypothetical protein